MRNFIPLVFSVHLPYSTLPFITHLLVSLLTRRLVNTLASSRRHILSTTHPLDNTFSRQHILSMTHPLDDVSSLRRLHPSLHLAPYSSCLPLSRLVSHCLVSSLIISSHLSSSRLSSSRLSSSRFILSCLVSLRLLVSSLVLSLVISSRLVSPCPVLSCLVLSHLSLSRALSDTTIAAVCFLPSYSIAGVYLVWLLFYDKIKISSSTCSLELGTLYCGTCM
jgi:hypothetical protein